MVIDDCSVAVWAPVVSSSEIYVDWIARDVADGSSEQQWQCLAHMGAGLGVSPRIFHIQGLHDRAAHFIGLSGVCYVIGRRGLNMYPRARDPRESSPLKRAACGPLGLRESTLRLHLLHSVSRGRTPAKASVPPTHGGRYVPSRGLYADDCDIFGGSRRLKLRVASFLRGCALLRRRPETVAANSRAGGPSASVSVERPPSAAQRWECSEVDFAEFKRKALRELSGVLDFHIRGADAPVPAGRVCSFWKQLVEDNRAIAAGMRYPWKWPPALRNLSRLNFLQDVRQATTSLLC